MAPLGPVIAARYWGWMVVVQVVIMDEMDCGCVWICWYGELRSCTNNFAPNLGNGPEAAGGQYSSRLSEERVPSCGPMQPLRVARSLKLGTRRILSGYADTTRNQYRMVLLLQCQPMSK